MCDYINIAHRFHLFHVFTISLKYPYLLEPLNVDHNPHDRIYDAGPVLCPTNILYILSSLIL